jgi:OHCU decarboxylase
MPIELVIFAEEEGPTFGLGMLGSRSIVGELSPDNLATLLNSDGRSYLDAGAVCGVDPTRFDECRLNPHTCLGLIEVHIEQSPGMWNRDQRLAVVTAIAGRHQYHVTVLGEANHAGATSMRDRFDALAGTAEMIAQLESMVRDLHPDAVLTVGRLLVQPNAVNVIANRVDFTIDFRAPDDATLAIGGDRILETISSVAARRGLQVEQLLTESIPARPLNRRLAAALGDDLPRTVSGALHDSAVLAPFIPTIMLFVPSQGGISHNPAEFSRCEDIALAAERVMNLVRRHSLAGINAMPRDTFIQTFGGIYEHSAWVAERASLDRPFPTVDALREALRRAMRTSRDDEQLALINAHPDLVGRLAQEGRLTHESTAEQRAAGLSNLAQHEVTQFEQFNAAYRAKFGFPFIICARLNRKQEILEAFPTRLNNTREQEIAAALDEIDKIAELRLRDLFWEHSI